MILLSGGTDGGTKTHVVQIAELIAPAKPQPRFGSEYKLPIIYAGNKDAKKNITELFKEDFELSTVDNLRPKMELENLAPARDAIHDLFLEHVMAHAPGYNHLIKWTDAPIMPTPGAVGEIIQKFSKSEKMNVVGVDIGTSARSSTAVTAALAESSPLAFIDKLFPPLMPPNVLAAAVGRT